MKPSKLLLIITLMVFSTGSLFAQNNDIKARIEYEDAETAFQNKEYQKVITHLTEAEKHLGFWTAKIGYLKIITLDKIVNYGSSWNDNTAELYRQVKEYMSYADKNADKVDLDRMRELYKIEKKINYTKQRNEWEQMPEYKSGKEAYDNKNYEEAINLYKKAANKGNVRAMVLIGNLYREGKEIPQNYQEAMSWYKKAGNEGDSYSLARIGDMYGDGLGVNQDYSEAIQWYKKAADRGNITQMFYIAYFYYKLKNYTQAMEWYKKYYEVGNINAKNTAKEWIAKMYEEGLGVEKDINKAKEWRNK
jgi:TPR repeat protein